MATLPVREMVLYKHGVGFFVREGEVSGAGTELTFRQDEINDVLKSLAVFDRAGGQVLGIHYQTPMDKDARLASSSIRLSDTASLRDLLTRLRGRRAELIFETTPGTLETVNGRVIGVDNSPYPMSSAASLNDEMVSMLSDEGQVRVYRLSMIRALRILDSQAEHDLSYFLDTSMSEDVRRTVNVRLSEGDHQLVVYYVAPSPTWRVSYRLVAESEEGGEGGKALLQGWGLFDNRLEEDLDNVRVTLVAGQPISFIYDLYASRIPMRPTVRDEARVAPGPVEFAGARPAMKMAQADVDELPMLYREDAAPPPAAPAPAAYARAITGTAPMRSQDIARSAPAAAQTKDEGEFFQYVVTAPVSVKRGESALVPIVGSEISYQRELLYNASKLQDHPVVALRFNNSTGLTLERGPVTVVENGEYKGEAVVAFTKDSNQVYLPFAVELGVKVVERFQSKVTTTGLSIKSAYFIYERYNIDIVTYALENTTAKPLTVTIEARIKTGWELIETPPPDVETLTERRWKVDVPAHGKIEFVTQQRERTHFSEEVRRLDLHKLQEITQKGWLNEGVNKLLADILENLGKIQKAQAKLVELANERKSLYERQEQIRANLGALQATGQEATLRNRMLGQLEASQNRIEAVEQEGNNLQKEINEAEQLVNRILANLG